MECGLHYAMYGKCKIRGELWSLLVFSTRVFVECVCDCVVVGEFPYLVFHSLISALDFTS
jgi:hypothetical protein